MLAELRRLPQRGSLNFQLFQLPQDFFLRFLIEAGSYTADELQFLPVIKTQDQRAKILPRAARRRPPEDRRIEFIDDLQLDPQRRAISGIGTLDVLSDDALEALFLGGCKKVLALFQVVLRVAHAHVR